MAIDKKSIAKAGKAGAKSGISAALLGILASGPQGVNNEEANDARSQWQADGIYPAINSWQRGNQQPAEGETAEEQDNDSSISKARGRYTKPLFEDIVDQLNNRFGTQQAYAAEEDNLEGDAYQAAVDKRKREIERERLYADAAGKQEEANRVAADSGSTVAERREANEAADAAAGEANAARMSGVYEKTSLGQPKNGPEKVDDKYVREPAISTINMGMPDFEILQALNLQDAALNRQDPFAENAWVGESEYLFPEGPVSAWPERPALNTPDIYELSNIPQDANLTDEDRILADYASLATGSPTAANNMIDADWRNKLDYQSPGLTRSGISSQADELWDWLYNTEYGQQFLIDNPKYDVVDPYTIYRLETDQNILNRIWDMNTGVAGWTGKGGRYNYDNLDDLYSWWMANPENINDMLTNPGNYSLADYGGVDAYYDLQKWAADKGWYNDVNSYKDLSPEQIAALLTTGILADDVTANERPLTDTELADYQYILEKSGLRPRLGMTGTGSAYTDYNTFEQRYRNQFGDASDAYAELIPVLLDSYNNANPKRQIGIGLG